VDGEIVYLYDDSCGRPPNLILIRDACWRQNLLHLHPAGLRRYAEQVLSAYSVEKLVFDVG
jgi:hypothetical protein